MRALNSVRARGHPLGRKAPHVRAPPPSPPARACTVRGVFVLAARMFQEERLLLFRYIASWLTDSMCGRTNIEDLRVEGLQQMQAMIDAGGSVVGISLARDVVPRVVTARVPVVCVCARWPHLRALCCVSFSHWGTQRERCVAATPCEADCKPWCARRSQPA
jgi:hypothetical protein